MNSQCFPILDTTLPDFPQNADLRICLEKLLDPLPSKRKVDFSGEFDRLSIRNTLTIFDTDESNRTMQSGTFKCIDVDKLKKIVRGHPSVKQKEHNKNNIDRNPFNVDDILYISPSYFS